MNEKTYTQENAACVSKILKSMANSNRLLILCHLSEGPMKVGALEEKLKISQSALSQHLARLRDDGIVSFNKEAQSAYYYILDKRILEIMEVIDANYNTNA